MAMNSQVKTKVTDVEEIEQTAPSYDLKPTLWVIASAVIGLILGISIADGRGSDVIISWIKLPGDLFIRALKAVVLPLVFVNIILAVVEMIRAGKASSVGYKTIGLYTLTTLLASLEGLIFVLMFKSTFSDKDEEIMPTEPLIKIKCPEMSFDEYPLYVTEGVNGRLSCEQEANETNSVFFLNDVNNFLVEISQSEVEDDISFSQTLQDGIFRKMVSDNIMNEFINANFVGVIVFAIAFALSSQFMKMEPKIIIELLEESNRLFLKIIDWIIMLTPIAVLSLIAGNLGEQEDLVGVFKDIGVLIACTLLAMSFHFFITYPSLFLLFVRKNPIPYAKFMIPSQVFAFASASSAATLPISLECVKNSKQVPSSVANFVLSMGATLNMDGGGIYFPTAIVFLAIAEGLEDQLDGAAFFLIILLSTIGSAGTAPVPSASLVLIITAYNTVFDTTGTPDSFGLILAVDWFIDRFRTLLNVTGDMTMARIIAESAKVEMEELEVEL